MYMNISGWSIGGNDTDRGKQKYSEKNPSQ
jgi:hypothetical protein